MRAEGYMSPLHSVLVFVQLGQANLPIAHSLILFAKNNAVAIW